MRIACAALVAALLCAIGPAFAARPLLDRHQWDAYFALFARDSSVPWKPTTVRLDTYSGAPVDLAAYAVDPADVIVAGANRTPRALDTAHRTPVVRWRFSPPPGYRFESSDVAVPLGSREGFYVVEARRGDAVQQVWVNRTHVGLLTQESPEGLVLWGVDLHDGRAIANMPVSFLVGLRLVEQRTDRSGLIVWRGSARPAFALAEAGAGRAFVSLLPQAPAVAAIVGLRLESAAVRAGDRVRFVGFARKRVAGAYRRATGDVRVTLAGRGATLANAVVRLDAAGAFSGELTIPAAADSGDDTLLAAAAGGVGGTSVHVDAASDVALAVRPGCPCDPAADVPLAVTVRRGDVAVANVPVRVQIVRTPHVVPPGGADDAPRWGTTVVYDRTVRSDAEGNAKVLIPSASDGLDSTYGVRATTRGASATSRIVVPSAGIALALEPAALQADVGAPVAFAVRGFDPASGAPAANVAVRVRLTHGASVSEASAALDEHGTAHVTFAHPALGSNLAVAEATVDGRIARDAAAVQVEPSALAGRVASGRSAVSVATDRTRYRPGDRVVVRASAPGASGDALIALDGARTYAARVVSAAGGRGGTVLDLGDPQGLVRVSAAFVRDGAIATGGVPLDIDAPGHARATDVALDRATYAAGDTVRATIRDGDAKPGATIALRVAEGRESGSALFDDAPAVLASGATSAQAPASDDPAWHAYVAPARSRASDIFAAERPRKVATDAPSIGVAAPRTLLWRVARAGSGTLEFAAPSERGHFVVSILKMHDDGDVGAASASFTVR